MPEWKGVLDHHDAVAGRIRSVRKKLIVTTDPAEVRAWQRELADAETILNEASRMLERSAEIVPTVDPRG